MVERSCTVYSIEYKMSAVKAYLESGEPIKQFCRENNIKYQTFNDKLLDKCSFFFDEKLTNYYKEDFEAFKKKFKLIQCKYPSRSKQLIKAVNKVIEIETKNGNLRKIRNSFGIK